jgi:RNA polymerase sigma factor (sigma-70 family)
MNVEFAEIEAIGGKAAAGDRAALDTLLVEARPLILGRCRRFLPNPLDAEEAAQDALLAIARRIGTLEGRSKFTTWMYQLTSNAAIDTYRKLKRRRSVLEAPPDLAAGGSTPSVIAGARIDVLDAAEKPIPPRASSTSSAANSAKRRSSSARDSLRARPRWGSTVPSTSSPDDRLDHVGDRVVV